MNPRAVALTGHVSWFGAQRPGYDLPVRRVLPALLVVWFVIGAIAAAQRGYFNAAPNNCGKAGTITVTILAGPLNYVGANPKVANCSFPQPSR